MYINLFVLILEKGVFAFNWKTRNRWKRDRQHYTWLKNSVTKQEVEILGCGSGRAMKINQTLETLSIFKT